MVARGRESNRSSVIVNIIYGIFGWKSTARSVAVGAQELVDGGISSIFEGTEDDIAARHHCLAQADGNPVAHLSLIIPGSRIYIVDDKFYTQFDIRVLVEEGEPLGRIGRREAHRLHVGLENDHRRQARVDWLLLA